MPLAFAVSVWLVRHCFLATQASCLPADLANRDAHLRCPRQFDPFHLLGLLLRDLLLQGRLTNLFEFFGAEHG